MAINEQEHSLFPEFLAIDPVRTEDINSIIELGNRNNIKNLTDEERKYGFLSVEFTYPLVESFLTAPGVVVHSKKKLIAFLLNSKLPDEQYDSPPLKYTIKALKEIDYTISDRQKKLYDHNWVFYGPIAVDFDYRGKNIPKKMFDRVVPLLRQDYDIAISFMDRRNQSSMHLHVNKLAFKQVGDFYLNEHPYDVIVYKLR